MTTTTLALRELLRMGTLRTDSAILILLSVSDSLSISDIAEQLALELSTVGMAASRLRRDKLASFTQPLHDGRATILQLSAEGTDRVLAIRSALFELGLTKSK